MELVIAAATRATAIVGYTRVRVTLAVSLVVAAVLAFLAMVLSGYHAGDGDFEPVLKAVAAFLHGGHPYTVRWYAYPPSALLIFAPLGALADPGARGIFVAVDAVAIAVGLWLCADLAKINRRSLLRPALLLVATAFAPIATTVHLINVNGVIFMGECAVLAAAATGRWRLSGLILGLTLAVKPVLLPLLILPLLRRRLTPFVLAVCVPVGLSVLGLEFSVGPHEFFTRTVAFILRGNDPTLQVYNASLSGVGSDWHIAIGVITVLRGAVALFALLLVAKRIRHPDTGTVGAMVDTTILALAGTFLVFSFSWAHYAIYLLPAFVLALCGQSLMSRRWLIVALLLVGTPATLMYHLLYPLHLQGAKFESLRYTTGFAVVLLSYGFALLRTRSVTQLRPSPIIGRPNAAPLAPHHSPAPEGTPAANVVH